MTSVRVAIAQAEIAADLTAGLEKTRTLARRAASEGAQLVAFPETWLPGYPAWLDACRDAGIWDHPRVKEEYARMAENSVVVGGASGESLSAIAREAAVTLVVGVVERVAAGAGRGTLFNSLLTYAPDGRLANHHRKLMPTFTERLVWGTGDANGLRCADTPVGSVGGLICWEHWMPLARQAMHDAGEDIHVAVWPAVREMHEIASRHYAFEGRCFVLAAGSLLRTRNLPRGMDVHPTYASSEWALRGGSLIVAPDGRILAGPIRDEERVLIADLDLSMIAQESMTLDVSGHYSRPDCFEFRPIRHTRAST